MSARDTAVVRGARADEQERVLQLLAGEMNAHREYFLANYRNHPKARPEHSRVVEVGGRLVSHVRIYDQDVRLGNAVMRVGAIGDVVTRPGYRRRGYARLCLEDAAGYMRAEGYDYSMVLSGVAVYEHCGWERTPETVYTLPLPEPAESCAAPSGVQVRRLERDGDLAEVASVYADFCARRSGTQVRSNAYWRRHFNWIAEDEAGFLVATRDERVVAYARTDVRDDGLQIREGCVASGEEAVASALLGVVLRYAHKRHLRRLVVRLPADHPWVDELRASTGFSEVVEENLWVRVINLRQMLAKVTEARSVRGSAEAEIAIECAGQSGRLRVSLVKEWLAEGAEGNQRTVHWTCSQSELFAALLRRARPSSLGWLSQAALTAEIRALDACFSGRAPVHWRTDGV